MMLFNGVLLTKNTTNKRMPTIFINLQSNVFPGNKYQCSN